MDVYTLLLISIPFTTVGITVVVALIVVTISEAITKFRRR